MPNIEMIEYVTFSIPVRLNTSEIEHLRAVKERMGALAAVRSLKLKVDIDLREAKDYIDSL